MFMPDADFSPHAEKGRFPDSRGESILHGRNSRKLFPAAQGGASLVRFDMPRHNTSSCGVGCLRKSVMTQPIPATKWPVPFNRCCGSISK